MNVRFFRSLPILLALAPAAPAVRGQLPVCDSLAVSLSATNIDPLAYSFELALDAPNHTLLQVGWDYGDGSTSIGASLTDVHTYAAPDQALACALILAQNNNTLELCTAAACSLIDVSALGPTACDSLVLDYVVEFDSGAFYFYPQSGNTYMALSYQWDFGDGVSIADAQPDHVFPGTGPYQVCLTAFGLDSLVNQTCSVTACHWIYFGPDTIPCSDVVTASFQSVVFDSWVAYVNTSVISGMSGEATWDFGDGEITSGDVVTHHYDQYGDFTTCLTQRVWGPLAPDTCAATVCSFVSLAAVGVTEIAPPLVLMVFPQPFSDAVTISSAELQGPVRIQLFDVLGRVEDDRTGFAHGELRLDYCTVPPGDHVLRIIAEHRVFTTRLVKR